MKCKKGDVQERLSAKEVKCAAGKVQEKVKCERWSKIDCKPDREGDKDLNTP